MITLYCWPDKIGQRTPIPLDKDNKLHCTKNCRLQTMQYRRRDHLDKYAQRRLRLSHRAKFFAFLSLLLIVFAIPMIVTYMNQQSQSQQHAATTIQAPSLVHFTGGFSIDTPDKVTNAAADGIQVDLKYGAPYSPTD